jgi:hypothetical protein
LAVLRFSGAEWKRWGGAQRRRSAQCTRGGAEEVQRWCRGCKGCRECRGAGVQVCRCADVDLSQKLPQRCKVTKQRRCADWLQMKIVSLVLSEQ